MRATQSERESEMVATSVQLTQAHAEQYVIECNKLLLSSHNRNWHCWSVTFRLDFSCNLAVVAATKPSSIRSCARKLKGNQLKRIVA